MTPAAAIAMVSLAFAGPAAAQTPVVESVVPFRGPAAGGTVVMLKGKGFTGAEAVRFDSRSTNFEVNSDSQITTVSPPLREVRHCAECAPGEYATAYPKVTTPAGTSEGNLFFGAFDYGPTVASVEPRGGPATGGNTVTIRGQGYEGFLEAGAFCCTITFGASEAASYTLHRSETGETWITTVAPPGTGAVDVKVETEGGLSPISAEDQYTYAIPIVATEPASLIRRTSATLNASVNPNNSPVGECRFEYGPTTLYGSSVPCIPSPGSGGSPVAVSSPVSGLSENTSYHFRVVATSPAGTSYGVDRSLATTTPPGPHWFKNGVRLKEGATLPILTWGGATNLAQADPAGETSCKTAGAGTIVNAKGEGEETGGNGPAGTGQTQSAVYYECKAPKCEAEVAASPLGSLGFKGVGFVQAYNLPWKEELFGSSAPFQEFVGSPPSLNLGNGFSEGFPAMSQPPSGTGSVWGAPGAIGMVMGCEVFPNPEGLEGLRKPARVPSEMPLEGELHPLIGGALNEGGAALHPAKIEFAGKTSGELEDPLGPGSGGYDTGQVKYLGYGVQDGITVEPN